MSRKFRYVYEIYNTYTEEIVATPPTLKECKLEFVKWQLQFGGRSSFNYRKVKVRTFIVNET